MESVSYQKEGSPQSLSAQKNTLLRILILVGVIALVILVIGVVFIIRGKNESQPAALPTEISVELTNDGFNPSEITIQKGAAVRWTNKTNDEHASVNSDDHPTNKKYPELNLGEIPQGSTVVHIFENSGTYTYHDYFHPERKGTIIVK